ncbi:MAG TPA: O-antigen ligase family protein [Phycisphaerae bacterium]|nr:O-antigen ligase family protein [Phycisphaerae bacterium]
MSQAAIDSIAAPEVRTLSEPRIGAIQGQHPVAYVLFILVNATLFIRPGEIFPATESLPIYLWLIAACAAAALPAVLTQLRWSNLSRNAGVFCVLMLLPAIFLSHASHFNFYSARYGAIDFSKILLYFLLLIALINTRARLENLMALTVLFITVTAVFALLNYHEIYTLPALVVLNRADGVPGDDDVIRQLQATGIFSDPNDFSGILVTAILATLHFVIKPRTPAARWRWLLVLPILLYAFALTRSRGGFLSLMAGAGCLLICKFGWRNGLKIGTFILPLFLVAFAGRQTNIDVGNKADTAYGRILLWREGMRMFKAAPFFGHGFDTYAEEATQVAHNSFVHAYAELGFFGGTLFLSAFLAPIFSALKFKPKGQSEMLAITIFSILVAYAVGIFSLSRCYSNATYLVVGFGCAYCAMQNTSHNLPWMNVNGQLLKRMLKASVLMFLFIYVFIRVMTL